MKNLLGFVCAELDCYLDDLKGQCRGEMSKKRKLAVLSLVWKNATVTQIAELLNKDKSSIRTIVKNSNLGDYFKASQLVKKYEMWKNYTQDKK